MEENELISYFESLAKKHTIVNHDLNGKESFFVIENSFDLTEFDNALRNKTSSPAMMLINDEGVFDDNGSENHTDDMECQLYIVAYRNAKTQTIPEIRKACKTILRQILAKVKKDARFPGGIAAGKIVHYHITRNSYQKVGPINNDWYGYAVSFKFICPLGFPVEEGTWRDI